MELGGLGGGPCPGTCCVSREQCPAASQAGRRDAECPCPPTLTYQKEGAPPPRERNLEGGQEGDLDPIPCNWDILRIVTEMPWAGQEMRERKAAPRGRYVDSLTRVDK